MNGNVSDTKNHAFLSLVGNIVKGTCIILLICRNPLVYLDETALRLALRLAHDANRNECVFLLMGSLASESGLLLFKI